MIKAVTLFLIVMVALAVFFRHRIPGISRQDKFCPACGRPRIGKGPCPCGKASK